ncbi:MAG: MurR/RpiR family transcriptional regulator [Lactobacillus sp.]|jgi:DNA-binding MurR/RpiR family transcriptional regulator|nr:MurR/RpiR family transcriptional regulator [Lactobacillus sp.]MCI2033883.1 MurR/RpiR family transcriptional regulator [Lactobacillus sp.]
MDNIIDQLYSHLPKLTGTDHKLATVILADPGAVVNLTIAALAKKAGVSSASVTRFCRTIGLAGFHQLKIALARVASNPGPDAALDGNDLHAALARIAANKRDEILTTLNAPEATISAFLTQLKNASVIQVAAAGGTQPVALDAVYKFNQLGRFAFTDMSGDTAIAQTLNLPTTGVLLVISNSGETRRLLDQITIAKKRGIPVLALTNRADSPIGLQATEHLQTAVRQRVFESEYFFSRVAAMTAIEALFLLLLAQEPTAMTHIKAHEALIAKTKV